MSLAELHAASKRTGSKFSTNELLHQSGNLDLLIDGGLIPGTAAGSAWAIDGYSSLTGPSVLITAGGVHMGTVAGRSSFRAESIALAEGMARLRSRAAAVLSWQ